MLCMIDYFLFVVNTFFHFFLNFFYKKRKLANPVKMGDCELLHSVGLNFFRIILKIFS